MKRMLIMFFMLSLPVMAHAQDTGDTTAESDILTTDSAGAGDVGTATTDAVDNDAGEDNELSDHEQVIVSSA